MPTNETTRRTRSMAADDGRLSAAETKPKTPNTPTAHAPIDIGSQNLKTRIMFMKRAGTPRSAMRSAPQTATSGRAMKYPTRATFLSPAWPKRTAEAAGGDGESRREERTAGGRERQGDEIPDPRDLLVARFAEEIGDGGGEVRAAGDAAEEEVPDDQHLPARSLKHRHLPGRASGTRAPHRGRRRAPTRSTGASRRRRCAEEASGSPAGCTSPASRAGGRTR